MELNSPLEQVYFYENQFPRIPKGEAPIKITQGQYHRAVNLLPKKGYYIPSEENPNGNILNDRRFLHQGTLVELNGVSQIHSGGNTRTIRIYSEESHNIERCVEALALPLPQTHLVNKH